MKQPKCRDCGQPIAWFGVEWLGGARRPFEPKPVDPAATGRPAFPVWNGVQAWTLPALVDELQVRRECSHDEAEDEARAMDFYVRHQCPNAPDRAAPTEQEVRV